MGKEDGAKQLSLPNPPPRETVAPTPPPKALTEFTVILAEKDAKLADAHGLSAEDYKKAVAANNADVFTAIDDGASVDEAIALIQLDEDPGN